MAAFFCPVHYPGGKKWQSDASLKICDDIATCHALADCVRQH
jgi:hypothetical protein